MSDSTKLAAALADTVGVETKTANVLTEDFAVNPASALQGIVGVDRDAVSAFAQTSPDTGHGALANPFSPMQGDEIFWTYMLPGAVFQAHDNQYFLIESYDFQDKVHISNVWYPRQQGVFDIETIRKSISAWVDPVQITVPPPPVGVNYGTMDVREVA